MDWLRKNWQWLVLNLFAVAIITTLLLETTRRMLYASSDSEVVFEQSGRWAIRFLLFSLAMTPAAKIFGWRGATKLRKPAGLWAFAFAGLHLTWYLKNNWSGLNIRELITTNYVILGIIGLAILTLLALTSTTWGMQNLGKWWKRLHRLVYLAGCSVILHALIAGSVSKRGLIRDGNMAYEFRFYLIILIILLALRIPQIRQALSFSHRFQRRDSGVIPESS